VSDDPAKTLDRAARTDILLIAQLVAGNDGPQRSFDLVSPYFVPAERGTAALVSLAQRGVRVRILTNSLQATDVSVVHSGYAKRRCALARAGIQLYELKPSAAMPAGKRKKRDDDEDNVTSSKASLHAKTFAADGERLFVGSFNFDPRSALLNTEMGLVIDSPALAQRLSRAFDDLMRANAYEVRAREGDACVEWIEHTAAGEVRHMTEPHTGAGRRAWLQFLMALPLDWML
jgi:putative cardiolipin synthase